MNVTSGDVHEVSRGWSTEGVHVGAGVRRQQTGADWSQGKGFELHCHGVFKQEQSIVLC